MEAKLQIFRKEGVKTRLNLLLSVICRALWLIKRPRRESKKKKKNNAAKTKQKASNWKDDCLVLGG